MKSLGQNTDILSESDILKINSIYGTECFGGEPSPTQIEDKDEKSKNEKEKKPHKKRDDKEQEFEEGRYK